MSLYLYGIFPLPEPTDLILEGLDKQQVKTQVIDGFVFLYSEAKKEKYLASRRHMICHTKVLEDAMTAGYRNHLPLQFGLIVSDWEIVRKQLTIPYGEKLNQLFIKLAGKREVGVKIFWDNESELQTLLEENPDLKARRDSLQGKVLSMDEVIRIGQTLESAMKNRQNEIIQAFQNTLNPLALEIVESDNLTDKMIYNCSYLIPWDNEANFSENVDNLDAKFAGKLSIRYNNFTPPYYFAKLEDFE
jgi:Gas vesicle synthesis protein GvpL/GvpF